MTANCVTVTEKLGPGNYRGIARKCSLDPTHVSRILRGKVTPSLTTAVTIANAAEVTVDELNRYVEEVKTTDMPLGGISDSNEIATAY